MEYFIPFSENDYKRYSRHFIIREMKGNEGMNEIKSSHVAVFGAGGLGCPLTSYLVGAGIGKLTIFDNDIIDISNLSRQVLYTQNDVGKNKVDVLSQRLKMMNPEVELNPICVRFNVDNFENYLDPSFTIIVDCTDNIETRYLINELALRLNLPLVSAGALIWDGQLVVYNYKGGPCFRCIFPNPPQGSVANRDCNQNGIIGPVVGILGCLQALETLKVILNLPMASSSKMLIYDGLYNDFRTINVRGRRQDCPSCCPDRSFRISYRDKLAPIICELDYSSPQPGISVSVHDLQNIVSNTTTNPYIESYIIIDVREPHEYSMMNFKNSKSMPHIINVDEK